MNAAFHVPYLATGLALMVVTAFIVIGGLKRVAAVTEKLVPLMALFYVAGAPVSYTHLGHIAGWAVEDPAMLAQIDAALAALGSQEAFDAKYPQARGAKPGCRAVGRVLAVLFACFCILASFGIGNMSQINSIAGNMNAAFHVPYLATGLALMVVTAFIVIGGLKRLSLIHI